MKFTIIGHACLFIETGNQTILVDPWLSGSCYWRSWWHFPPNTAIRPEFLKPDYIYLSHHHFDHFHYPSLRKISRAARVLVPRFGVDVMRSELDQLGFRNVTELSHGVCVKLAGGTRLASYQYGPDDSALVVHRDGVVLVDLNDCKISGSSAQPMLRAFGRPTFMFKSHSFAQAYPNCYEFADAADAAYMTREDFVYTFVNEVREMRPQFAVPFASMVAFLHPESQACNQYAVRPPEVAAAVNDADAVPGSKAVVMVPGDQWDSKTGFHLQQNDYYTNLESWLGRLAELHRPKLVAGERKEMDVKVSFTEFEKFFTKFLKALPPFIWLILRLPIVFYVASDINPWWVLDFRHRKVRRLSVAPDNRSSVIRMNEAMLADAIARNVVGFTHISMRLRIELAKGAAPTDLLFWGVLSVGELGYLPLHRMLTPRAVVVLWRRRAEVVAMLRAMMGFQSIHKNMLRHLKSNSAAAGRG